MPQQSEFDKTGFVSSCYFLGFSVMLLIPVSFPMWPENVKEEQRKMQSQISIHGESKWFPRKQNKLLKRRLRGQIIKPLIFAAWVVAFLFFFKVSSMENDFSAFDPYGVLGVSDNATTAEVKRRYRNLAKDHHPDKGGNPERFIMIRRAFESLTNEHARNNWENYGDPDGPQSEKRGIALPQWIVEPGYSVWILGLYLFFLMIALPVVVHVWWKHPDTEEVLSDTTQIYYRFMNKYNPYMNLKKCIAVFTSSVDFSPDHNPKVSPFSTADNEELPELQKTLQRNYGYVDSINHIPFTLPYSLK